MFSLTIPKARRPRSIVIIQQPASIGQSKAGSHADGTTPAIQVDMLNVPDLGIDLIDTRQLPYSYQRPCDHGWVIHNVRYGSLGELMGLRKGDVIIGVNHHYIALPASAFVEPTKPMGATLTVRRHNQIMKYQLSK